jgi:hypothetical protein
MIARKFAFLAALLLAAPLSAEERSSPSPRDIVEAGVEAHGGEAWLRPGTLSLAGEAVFFSPDSAEPRSRAAEYRMWRKFDPDRKAAHGAAGKVRIVARDGERTLFEVGYDGATTWTEKGVMPKAEADAYWANNFGFGIVRSALRPGFSLEAVPSRDIGGHEVDLVRIIDPEGQATLFGFDRDSRFIRYMGFDSPRGWHERVYGDFVRLPESGWVQAREVTLFYGGVKANRVFWRHVAVGEPIEDSVFRHSD